MLTTYWSVTSVIILYILIRFVFILILEEYSWLLPTSKVKLLSIMIWTLHYVCYIQWQWCHVNDDYRNCYFIRLNALDFRDLQDKVSRPITVLQNVTFHRTLTDRFLDAFREQVADNPVYETSQVSFKSACECKVYFLIASRNSVWFIITYFRNLFNHSLFSMRNLLPINLTRAYYPSSCLGLKHSTDISQWKQDSVVLFSAAWVEWKAIQNIHIQQHCSFT